MLRFKCNCEACCNPALEELEKAKTAVVGTEALVRQARSAASEAQTAVKDTSVGRDHVHEQATGFLKPCGYGRVTHVSVAGFEESNCSYLNL